MPRNSPVRSSRGAGQQYAALLPKSRRAGESRAHRQWPRILRDRDRFLRALTVWWNALDPHAWLTTTLTALADGYMQSNIADLMFWNHTAKGFVRLPGPECYDPPSRFSDGQVRGIVGPKAERVSPCMTVRSGGEAMAFRAEQGGDLIVG